MKIMILIDCVGTEFCNNQPDYPEQGFDCYVNNDLCEDFNGDGIMYSVGRAVPHIAPNV